MEKESIYNNLDKKDVFIQARNFWRAYIVAHEEVHPEHHPIYRTFDWATDRVIQFFGLKSKFKFSKN